MLGTIAALSPKLCNPSSQRERERDQRRINDPLDTTIKLLDRDIQRHIRQEAQDQCRSLLESSDRATNPKRCWSLLRKLGGKRSSPPPNISITFDEKNPIQFKRDCMSLQQTVYCLFCPTRSGHQKVYEGPPMLPTCGSLLQAV